MKRLLHRTLSFLGFGHLYETPAQRIMKEHNLGAVEHHTVQEHNMAAPPPEPEETTEHEDDFNEFERQVDQLFDWLLEQINWCYYQLNRGPVGPPAYANLEEKLAACEFMANNLQALKETLDHQTSSLTPEMKQRYNTVLEKVGYEYRGHDG